MSSKVLGKNLVLISSPIIFKQRKGKAPHWFIVKQKEEGSWELPKVMARKAESSVRAGIRMMGEKGGMSIKVLEEAGRAGGVTSINDKTLPKRELYYLAWLKSESGEPVGFAKSGWFEYANAVRKLASKRERKMIKKARKVYRKWKKEKQKEKQKEKKKK